MKENSNCMKKMKENTTSIRKLSEEITLRSYQKEVMEAALIQPFTAMRKKAIWEFAVQMDLFLWWEVTEVIFLS